MTSEFELSHIVREEDFVKSPDIWNEQLAQQMAREDGLGDLGEPHWRVIKFLRQHFIQYGALPPMRFACEANELDPHCVQELFHGAREAWRIAGLPAPGEEAYTYMD